MNRFSVKPEVYFNEGSIKYLKTLKIDKALIVTDDMMVQVGVVDKVAEVLKSNCNEYKVFSKVKPDPPVEIVAMGVKVMTSFNPDVVIALGGGSSIDAAKSIIIFAANMMNKIGTSYKKPLFIAVPTTSGTGSEVTNFSVITVEDKKFPIITNELIPDVAIVDADFVKTAPPKITADTAIDALTHAIEAYVSTKASDYTDALSEKSVKLIFKYLLSAYKDGTNIKARQKLHNASCMAGMAFTNASLGLNHGMAHALGGAFHIPHGRANAILLPYIIKFNANIELGVENEVARRYAELSRILGLPSSNVKEGVENLIFSIKVLLRETSTPSTLKEVRINKEEFLEKIEVMANNAMKDRCTITNPRIVCLKDIIKLYLEAYEG
ncbi:alcohol dehydrogenase [Clostridium novyi A str. BKT29909]|uniref:1-propanol dehydrogenase PduQ n=1 Tax=Clostridium TaxID=1485 RepID=UPI0004D686E7|nr:MULTISPECIES: 1-propanol dehydrogenase PduQ [Clostridium]KEH90882.1 alcohol dehydrogenase [Clostridium novyi A str. BKT29909]KEH93893.1 alcohol dehydrogenase [Clostridium botulinum C/D str. It1]